MPRLRDHRSIITCVIVLCMTAARWPAGSRRRRRALPTTSTGLEVHQSDATGADAVAFDDSKWDTVSTPHTYTMWTATTSSSPQRRSDALYGPGVVPKHFKLPANLQGNKIFLEFEECVRQRSSGQWQAGGQI